MALSCTVLSYLTLNNRDLEIWVIGHRKSFKLLPFESLDAVSYSPSIVTMSLSSIISKIKRDSDRSRDFFIPLLHSTSPLGGPRRNIAIPFGTGKLEWWGYPTVKKV